MAEGGGDRQNQEKSRIPRRQRVETTQAIVPRYEELDENEHVTLSLADALLRYNLQLVQAEQPVVQAVASATGELVQPPDPAVLAADPGSVLRNFGTPGLKLRALADAFKRSRHAEVSNRLADETALNDVTSEWFHDVLTELFTANYSMEAFVTLFHFVSRLLIRSFREQGLEAFKTMCRNVISWFLLFVLKNLASYVVDLVRSLSDSERRTLNNTLMFGGACASAGALVTLVGCYFLFRK